MKIAIITARGGSKRIHKKNIKDFCGKPIIAYSIESAINSEVFDEVMVSTDDAEIAEISKKYGAVVPFMRSAKTSDDFSTTADVLKEVIEQYESLGKNVESFCCIYPTAPFVTAEKLAEANKLFEDNNASTVMTVVQFSYPPQRSLKLKDGFLEMNYPEFERTRSQDLEPVYHDCGQLYFARTADFIKSGKIIGEKTVPLIVSELEVQDIDTITDWQLAENKFKLIHNL